MREIIGGGWGWVGRRIMDGSFGLLLAVNILVVVEMMSASYDCGSRVVAGGRDEWLILEVVLLVW